MTTAPLTAPADTDVAYPLQPIAITLSEQDDSTPAQAAAARREEAWRTRDDWSFQGQPLEKWSMARESLFIRLVDADAPGEALENIQLYERHIERVRADAEKEGRLAEVAALSINDLVSPMNLISAAAKVLYLASHKPEIWDRFRGRDASGRFLREIEEWAERVIEPQECWAAILLARDLRERHRDVIAVRRPYPGGSQHLGN